MTITREKLEQILKEELENVLEGVAIPWCVGFEKDGEMHHERVSADAPGVAERNIRRKYDLPDRAIISTHNMNEKKDTKCKKQ
jgi:hypothetical protein